MKKFQIISKRALLCCSFLFLINSTGQMAALSLADRARESVRKRITQLRAKVGDLQKGLDAYQQCVFKGTCTSAQKSNLKKIGVAIAALVALLLAAGAVKLAKGYQDKKKELELKEQELARLRSSDIASEEKIKRLEEEIALAKSLLGVGALEAQESLDAQLVTTVMARSFDQAEQLIKKGARIDGLFQNKTALEWVVSTGNKAGVVWLLEKGANPRDDVSQESLDKATDEIKDIISAWRSKFGIFPQRRKNP